MTDCKLLSYDLPISQVIPDILDRLQTHDSLVLQAPPGAGKTTLVPLYLLGESWARAGRIIMLEPRRLAARAAARRMADMLGEAVGQTVGYRVRFDHKVSDKTRIEVVTEGVLIRRLQQDPELSGVSAVIFDEFHERSLEADFGLALCLDVQQGLRPELKLMVMSATLDGENVARLMGDAPVVSSEGRAYPVAMQYLDRPARGPIERTVAEAVARAVTAEAGSILVFLPGAGEIERCAGLLKAYNFGPDVIIAPLYGMMRMADQDRAIQPAPAGQRKIVLATAIAETSLTIEGIRVVIDGGLDRSPRYDVRSGMTRLETRTLSRASATQRAGRAGRLTPGICYRMWTEAAQRGLSPFAAPEITTADLVPLVLELANWGVGDPAELSWLDEPDPAAVAQARDLLQALGALDHQGRILAHGRQMAQLAMHPRLAHMVLTAKKLGFGGLGVWIAALLAERDILRNRSADMTRRLELLGQFLAGDKSLARKGGADMALLPQIKRLIEVWSRSLKLSRTEACPLEKTGLCLALAYPDRIGGRRPGGEARYLLSGGRGAALDPSDALGSEKYIAICHLDKGAREARIYLAAPLMESDIEDIFADQITVEEQVEWDGRSDSVIARRCHRLNRLILRQEKLKNPDPAAIIAALCQGIRKMGLAALPWDKKSSALRERILFCARHDPEGHWPDMSEEALLAGLETWLAPYLSGILRREQLKGLAMMEILNNLLGWQDSQRLDRMMPTHFKAPSGSSIALDYSVDPPVLSVRLQEMFGLDRTPTIMGGKLRLLVHLLSPAGRPLQVTQDLENFWVTSYEAVKKEMKGRYPRHHWPDDPLGATATNRIKKRMK
ncbi:MAG: ATP-dependent helicase HrpB [Alphaproteobacteria bacterium]|nr:MAG: ATP-dependent helicase HrpB [Alphaproteobacteria bacterium]